MAAEMADKADIGGKSSGAAVARAGTASRADRPARAIVANSEKRLIERKKRSKAAPLIVLLAVLAAAAAVLAFDVFGLRTGVVIPALEQAPIIRNLLPPANAGAPADAPAAAELSARVNDLTGQLLQSQRDVQTLIDSNDALRAENDRLKVFEAQQEQFKSDKAAFDRMIAMNDPQAYADFYASVSPENAEKLYGEAVGLSEQSAEERKYAKLIAGMDSAAAAAALETLVPTDIGLVVSVLGNMDSASASAILNEMKTKNAAVVAKMMAPAP